MKIFQKAALIILSVGVVIGLSSHIDAIYQNKSKQAAMRSTNVNRTNDARTIVKHAQERKKNMKLIAQAKIMGGFEKGGISLRMVDKERGESYLLFKKVKKYYGFMNEADLVSVATEQENLALKQATFWGKSGKFKLYTKEVTDWQKPSSDHVWVSEQEIKRAIGIARTNMTKNAAQQAKVTLRTKHGQRVELDKNLFAALSNHYSPQEIKPFLSKRVHVSQTSIKSKKDKAKAA